VIRIRPGLALGRPGLNRYMAIYRPTDTTKTSRAGPAMIGGCGWMLSVADASSASLSDSAEDMFDATLGSFFE